MDLSLLIFTLETYEFCMKCIEFTIRTYNFKNLVVGSLIWSAKTGVSKVSDHNPPDYYSKKHYYLDSSYRI